MTKRAILYIRVSTDEQAEKGFSLDAQKALLEKYCMSKGYEVIKIIREDFSAWKGFNRPGYNELRKFLTGIRNKVDTILFTQWSRFSREYTESVIEIKRLRGLGIEPNAVEQFIDFSIPENLYMLAIYLAAPQVENDRLSQRTKAGMREAVKQGRWLWKAPFGYINNNQKNKSIEVDEQAAELVQKCFQSMGTGLFTAEEVRRECNKSGLPHTKQAFLNMLQNVLYTGRIRLPAFKDEPAQIVSAQHEPIVSLELFAKVQLILSGKKKSYKGVTKSSETPLVNHLYCPKCDKPMTGSASKGNGGIYHYYHCQRKYGCNNSISALKANAKFTEFLTSFQPRPEMILLYEEFLAAEFKFGGNDREKEIKGLTNEINLIDERMKTAALKNLDGLWDDLLFKQTKESLEQKKNELMVKLNELKGIVPEFKTYLANSSSLLANLGSFYKLAPTEIQKPLIGSIFPEKIYFENNSYRTTKTNDVLELIFKLDEALNEKAPHKNAGLVQLAPPSGLEPETL
jgi:site-specific DNA recombinase